MIETVSHYFSGGIYAKHVRIHDGYSVVSHKHKFDHMSLLSSGCAIVEVDGDQQTYYAPAVISVSAGKAHSVTAVNGDVDWFCIHEIGRLEDPAENLGIDGQLIMDDELVAECT